jgi:hypothetical protein
MSTELKRKIAFAMLMGVVTTGIISLVLVAINLGNSSSFVSAWLRSWATSYVIVIPAILLIGPKVQAQVDRIIN